MDSAKERVNHNRRRRPQRPMMVPKGVSPKEGSPSGTPGSRHRHCREDGPSQPDLEDTTQRPRSPLFWLHTSDPWGRYMIVNEGNQELTPKEDSMPHAYNEESPSALQNPSSPGMSEDDTAASISRRHLGERGAFSLPYTIAVDALQRAAADGTWRRQQILASLDIPPDAPVLCRKRLASAINKNSSEWAPVAAETCTQQPIVEQQILKPKAPAEHYEPTETGTRPPHSENEPQLEGTGGSSPQTQLTHPGQRPEEGSYFSIRNVLLHEKERRCASQAMDGMVQRMYNAVGSSAMKTILKPSFECEQKLKKRSELPDTNVTNIPRMFHNRITGPDSTVDEVNKKDVHEKCSLESMPEQKITIRKQAKSKGENPQLSNNLSPEPETSMVHSTFGTILSQNVNQHKALIDGKSDTSKTLASPEIYLLQMNQSTEFTENVTEGAEFEKNGRQSVPKNHLSPNPEWLDIHLSEGNKSRTGDFSSQPTTSRHVKLSQTQLSIPHHYKPGTQFYRPQNFNNVSFENDTQTESSPEGTLLQMFCITSKQLADKYEGPNGEFANQVFVKEPPDDQHEDPRAALIRKIIINEMNYKRLSNVKDSLEWKDYQNMVRQKLKMLKLSKKTGKNGSLQSKRGKIKSRRCCRTKCSRYQAMKSKVMKNKQRISHQLTSGRSLRTKDYSQGQKKVHNSSGISVSTKQRPQTMYAKVRSNEKAARAESRHGQNPNLRKQNANLMKMQISNKLITKGTTPKSVTQRPKTSPAKSPMTKIQKAKTQINLWNTTTPKRKTTKADTIETKPLKFKNSEPKTTRAKPHWLKLHRWRSPIRPSWMRQLHSPREDPEISQMSRLTSSTRQQLGDEPPVSRDECAAYLRSRLPLYPDYLSPLAYIAAEEPRLARCNTPELLCSFLARCARRDKSPKVRKPCKTKSLSLSNLREKSEDTPKEYDQHFLERQPQMFTGSMGKDENERENSLMRQEIVERIADDANAGKKVNAQKKKVVKKTKASKKEANDEDHHSGSKEKTLQNEEQPREGSPTTEILVGPIKRNGSSLARPRVKQNIGESIPEGNTDKRSMALKKKVVKVVKVSKKVANYGDHLRDLDENVQNEGQSRKESTEIPIAHVKKIGIVYSNTSIKQNTTAGKADDGDTDKRLMAQKKKVVKVVKISKKITNSGDNHRGLEEKNSQNKEEATKRAEVPVSAIRKMGTLYANICPKQKIAESDTDDGSTAERVPPQEPKGFMFSKVSEKDPNCEDHGSQEENGQNEEESRNQIAEVPVAPIEVKGILHISMKPKIGKCKPDDGFNDQTIMVQEEEVVENLEMSSIDTNVKDHLSGFEEKTLNNHGQQPLIQDKDLQVTYPNKIDTVIESTKGNGDIKVMEEVMSRKRKIAKVKTSRKCGKEDFLKECGNIPQDHDKLSLTPRCGKIVADSRKILKPSTRPQRITKNVSKMNTARVIQSIKDSQNKTEI